MKTYDFIGIGIGPFNLSIAALAEGLTASARCFLNANRTSPGIRHDGAGLPYADQFPERSGQRGGANQPLQFSELPGAA
ncbi:SidA/IucD/PvdA family monooxygenase [Cronobacter sakazakii]|uniref:SidA/IucD/PvdA family monooxygenase n=1 Tax=Cronobacter sakazakii TaxID=28141 RepID=UPI003081940C